jgi:hypothetical protein
MTKRPYIIGGGLLLFGYLEASAMRMERPISDDLMAFHRNEQLKRLSSKLGLLRTGY